MMLGWTRAILVAGCALGALASACVKDLGALPPATGGCLKLELSFGDNTTPELEKKLRASAAVANEVLCERAFILRVRTWPGFSYTSDTPQHVAARIAHGGTLKLRVSFFEDRDSAVLAREVGGAVAFNTANDQTGSPGNVAHEAMHVLGYSHRWNWPLWQGNTVPWRIGSWVNEIVAQSRRTCP